MSDGRHVYFASEVGNVFAVAATERFSVVSTNRLAAKCIATPAISEGTLLFRTRDRLIAVGARN